jgi:hypothetical protein
MLRDLVFVELEGESLDILVVDNWVWWLLWCWSSLRAAHATALGGARARVHSYNTPPDSETRYGLQITKRVAARVEAVLRLISHVLHV